MSDKTTSTDHPYKIGDNYFIRTVTFHYTGRMKAVYAGEIMLENAAWVADDGRFADAINTGTLSEVEPYPEGEVIINRSSIVDACVVAWALPRKQK